MIGKEWTKNVTLEEYESTFVLPIYKTFFSDQLAQQYRPLLYSHECLSGPPKALYYRIVWRNNFFGRDFNTIFFLLELPVMHF